jgi:hypothetical protein
MPLNECAVRGNATRIMYLAYDCARFSFYGGINLRRFPKVRA